MYLRHSSIATVVATLLAFFMAGCEDVVQINLASTGPRLVIEARMVNPYTDRQNQFPGPNQAFVISYSEDFYDPDIPTRVSGADVIVTGGNATYTAVEDVDNPGTYRFKVAETIEEGVRFKATVTVEGTVHEAYSSVVRQLEIDSLSFKFQEGGGFGLEEDEGYRLHVHFNDTPDYPDYGRLRVFRNGKSIGDYHLYDGKFSDGNSIDYDYFSDTFQPGDNGVVELWSMDKQMFDYFRTLSEVIVSENGSSIFDITPANPNTNWSNGALGYFGVYNLSGTVFMLPDSLQSNSAHVQDSYTVRRSF